MSDWHSANLEAIERRLAPLLSEPDGTLHEEDSGLHRIRVIKQGRQVHLYFVEPDGELAGPMSRIDLGRPLHLLATYMQAAMLGLAWRPEPGRVCVLGFGGGRLSLVLHHHLPRAVIDSVDIDPAFGPLAARFFGVTYDERQRLFVDDARAFLERGAGGGYGLVVMDAFRDSSDNLNHLATREFYELCRRRMVPGGVLCANLLRSDPRLDAKIAALRASFRTLDAVERRRSIVALASDQPRRSPQALVRAAAELERRYGFDFPLAEHAAALGPLRSAPGISPLSDGG
jgi:spermidine synthase